ncbi:uncharacterized protein LOC142929763 [Petromyzon marinus]|uniref:uncharacterized protein LOC142929763 n=1 Tax=Petromyzon marinus TaxID=7757 RepID=UPI003F717775
MDSFSMQTMENGLEEIYQRMLFVEENIPVWKKQNFITTEDIHIANKELFGMTGAYHKTMAKVRHLQFKVDHQQQSFSRLGDVMKLHLKLMENYNVAIKEVKEMTSQLRDKFKEDMMSLANILKDAKEYYIQRNLQRQSQSLEKEIEECSLRVSHLAATQSEEPQENQGFLQRMETQLMEALLLKENCAFTNVKDLGSTEEELHHVLRMDQPVLQTSV